MVLPAALRISLLLVATGLAACNGLPRSLTVRPGEASTFSLISRHGPQLTLRNASGGQASAIYSQAYSQATDQLAKVVPDAELQALLDVFTAEKLFALSLPRLPGNARDVLRLEAGGKTWFWARRGSYTDPREAGFVKARTYFLSLYNGSTAYHSGPNSEDGVYPTFLTGKQQVRRAKELRMLKERQGRKSGTRNKR